jgi:hypothetical protein
LRFFVGVCARPGKSKQFALIQPTLYASSALILWLIEIFLEIKDCAFTVKTFRVIIVFSSKKKAA